MRLKDKVAIITGAGQRILRERKLSEVFRTQTGGCGHATAPCPRGLDRTCRGSVRPSRSSGDVPLVGFFGNGEISSSRTYIYTGVLSVFCQRTSQKTRTANTYRAIAITAIEPMV